MNEQPIKEDFFNILRILSSSNNLTQRRLSSYLNVSLGKTNYLLKSLAKHGFIKIKNFTKRDQKIKKVRYLLTRKGLGEKLKLAYYFLERKEKEFLELKQELGKFSVKPSIKHEKIKAP